ncbi:MAG: PDZ domain-containing protein [Gemmatimonadaceae bacterium]
MYQPRLVAALLCASLAQTAGAQTRLLRQPTVSATQVAFSYANNLWVASRDGGDARRLTSFQGVTSNPKFSSDGRWIAFSGQYGGNTDVFIVPAAGGEPKRLTWHPGADVTQGWTPDGQRVVFASGRASPNNAPKFWSVGVEGDVETPLPMPRAWQGKIAPDGKHVAYRMNNSWDDERRNYRGGQNRAIWIMDMATHEVESPPWTDSKDIDPVWLGDVVYFASDRDGVHNVWSYDRSSKKLEQLTHFTDFDVKAVDAGGGVVVFEQGGYVHLLDPRTKQAKRLDISVRGDFPWLMPEWKDVSNRIANISLSPTGKRAAVEARGEIFTIPAEKGDWRNLTRSSGVAERTPSWSPDGKTVAYFSDAGGSYKLMLESQDGITPPRTIELPEPSFYYTPAWSPDGARILYTDAHLRLWVTDVVSGRSTKVDTDPYMQPDRSINPVWSPDSRWIAYAKRLPSLFRAIFVYDTQNGATRQLSDGMADATWPVFDASGKYLYWVASTDYGPRTGWLDMSSYDHPVTRAIYLAVLRKTDPSPFAPESDEEGAAGARRDSAGVTPAGPAPNASGSASGNSGARLAVAPVTIDFEGLNQRVLSLGVVPRDYGQLAAGIAGTLFFIENIPEIGTADTPQGGRGETLHKFTLKDRKATVFASGVTQYTVSADGRKLLWRGAGPQGAMTVVNTEGPPATAGQGRLTANIRMLVDPRAEYRQMFAEGWRNQREYLYVSNMQGADYAKVKAMYEPLLAHVAHREDFNYLLDMTGAEVAVGHSYVRGGDLPSVPSASGGTLGADFEIVGGRYRIRRIYDAESWNPELRAPLSGPGIDVKVGDYLVAIDGVELRAPDNIYRLLEGTANRQTVLHVNARPALEGARRVVVVPVTSEQGLRQRAWMESNRRLVDSLSGGKLAYVYIPNTGQPGYTSFNRYYFAQQDKQGAIIDERFNGGGSAADYIIDVLQRDFDGYFNNREGDRKPFTSPAAGIWGPKVMIINEMAGSGGDLMPYMFRHRKIGPLVGKRTWGGLVGTWDTPALIDGGTMIAPRGGFFSKDGKWAVENEGVAPDIDVENWPKDVIAGRDPQLESAVREAMKLLQANPVTLLPEPPPPVWGKRKP